MKHPIIFSISLFMGTILPLRTIAQTTTAPGVPASASASAPLAVTAATVPPAELAPYGANWRPKGSGALRFFGFKVYDATLWVPADSLTFSFARPMALEIRYATPVKASDIVNTSLIEATRISGASSAQVAAWTASMNGIFVDVKAGDRLTGVHLPSVGARFFLNGKLLGESNDVEFSEAFFRIWLDPKSRKPELRAALLGLTP
jgi:hypothetical protein